MKKIYLTALVFMSVAAVNAGTSDLNDTLNPYHYAIVQQILDSIGWNIPPDSVINKNWSTTNITYLNLDNRKGLPAIRKLPALIGKLTLLTSLSLKDDSLSSLPSIGALGGLQYLDLNGNDFDTLPASFDSLQSLVFLDCDSNSLTSISAGLVTLPALRSLSLNYNDLASLPLQIVNSGITSISVSNNQMCHITDTLSDAPLVTWLNARDSSWDNLQCTLLVNGKLVALYDVKAGSILLQYVQFSNTVALSTDYANIDSVVPVDTPYSFPAIPGKKILKCVSVAINSDSILHGYELFVGFNIDSVDTSSIKSGSLSICYLNSQDTWAFTQQPPTRSGDTISVPTTLDGIYALVGDPVSGEAITLKSKAVPEESFSLVSNSSRQLVQFSLSSFSPVKMRLMSLDGRLIGEVNGEYGPGVHDIALPGSGKFAHSPAVLQFSAGTETRVMPVILK